VAEELPAAFPAIFKGAPLRQMWAYNYDDVVASGIHMHGDNFAVNCNLWVTPDGANLDEQSGGLLIWTTPAPLAWDFDDFNTQQGDRKMSELVAGGERVRVAYRQNRIVLFKSDLLHATDAFKFKRGFANRRINLTFLYGARGHGEDARSIRQRTEQSQARRGQEQR
jgi:hypothetical protein